MGNYASCTLAKVPGARGAKVILPDGCVRQVGLPATAAELMLDAPGHFLADARAMQPGRRLAALAADEDLELGGVYAMFPMTRLSTPVAAADMARLVAVASKEARRSAASATAKVAAVAPAAPEATAEAVPRVRLDGALDDAAAAEIGEFKHRLSGCRSRRPTLETIQEENHASRS